MAERGDVVGVFPSQERKLHTTASWDFMKFEGEVDWNPDIESKTIIGVIDTGIWPESKSFDDNGFGPVPKSWKGACEGGYNFSCTKKIIGARYYLSDEGEEGSARDYNGHGTHTASTAAGNQVVDASFYGIGKGIARGAVPLARLAVYKVCGSICRDDGILPAFDDAIADSVNIITISIGADFPIDITKDTIAIGSFHAIEQGILTVHSAGNTGGVPGAVSSVAPWLFTVAASTMTRKFVAPVVLGNGKTLNGNGVNAFTLKNGTTQLPLVYGQQASTRCSAFEAERCFSWCLDRDLVEGKIVVCNNNISLFTVLEVNRTGGVGAIIVDDEPQVASVTNFPYSRLSLREFQEVVDYIKSTKTPTGNLLKTKAIEDGSAPNVAFFSSRGPNKHFPDILKPDITAPGVEILAAFSPAGNPSDTRADDRSVDYSILDGTSISCPHVTGAAAYVKSINPNLSPSAIKSALMTTAFAMDKTDSYYGDSEFGYGAGHLNPRKAPYPGLVYEILPTDYVKWICGKNFSTELNISCAGVVPIQDEDLNYPTMSAKVVKGQRCKVTFRRTVMNVGQANSSYKVIIPLFSPLDTTVVPYILSFKARYEKKSFMVIVEGTEFEGFTSSSIEWFDGNHHVRSPIVIFTD
ncbi:OLC1v1015582C2 [Oldenlandia corymbosa var. corymbosa]|nr:OLC1v1015582C2 [Oldenlandia corymbosa var. corymbosa]